MKAVILFHSSNYAIWADNELKNNNIKCKLVSVPRELSSDCGYCVKIAIEDCKISQKILSAAQIEFVKIENI